MTRLPADASIEPNPYAPPEAPVIGPGSAPSVPGDAEFRVFKHWERLRLVYNLALAAETVAFMAALGPWRNPSSDEVIGAAVAVFLANACFCAGPVLHCYAARIGARHRLVAPAIFGLGLLVSSLVVLACVLELVGAFD